MPSVSTTVSTCPWPRTSATPSPRRTSTPSSRCSRATSSPICSPSTAASGVRLRLDQHHVHPEAAQAGRHLAADETGADDDGAPRGGRVLAQRHALVERAQHPNALEVGKRRNAPRHQPGGDDEFVVAEHRSVVERHRLLGRIETGGGRAQSQGDVLLVVPLARFEGHVVDLFAQHLLGQRRTVVGQMHLVADDRDAPGVFRPTQLLGGAGGGKPAAHDHDVLDASATGHVVFIARSPVSTSRRPYRRGSACPTACPSRRRPTRPRRRIPRRPS